jgi:hypothetical protein
MVSHRLKPLSVIIVAGFFVSGCVHIKEAGRTIGHTTRDVTREIGHGTRDAANTVGDGVKKVVKPAAAPAEY